MDRDRLMDCLGQGMSLDRIAEAVDRHPSTVSYWLRKHGLKANGHEKHRPRDGIDRERLERLIARELTIREIAERLDASYTNVRYWIGRYGLRHARQIRQERIAEARLQGLARLVLRCKRHGRIEHRWHYNSFRCGRCMSEAVARRRRKVKRILLDESGGCCALCGYEGPPRALHFHHTDPGDKSFALSEAGVTRSISRLRAEAEKCVLLCSNCHAEVEEGITSLS